MPNSLSDYDVVFRQNRLLGTWHWYATKKPSGETLTSFGMLVRKESAEEDALRAIQRHDALEEIDGRQLRERVEARRASAIPAET